MPKPSSCKKSAAPKPKLPLEQQYACADKKLEIERLKKEVMDGSEKAKRIAKLMQEYKDLKKGHNKEKDMKPAQISLEEYDARYGNNAIPDDKGPNSALPADSD